MEYKIALGINKEKTEVFTEVYKLDKCIQTLLDRCKNE